MGIIENIIPILAPIIIVTAIIAFIISRQIRPRKLSKTSLLIMPAIVLFFLVKSLPSFHMTQKELLDMTIMSIVSIVLGIFATRELHVYEGPSGKAMAKGNWTYFLWWLAAFGIKAILSVIFGETSLKSVSQTEIFLPVFFLMVTRSAYLYWKVEKLELKLH